MILHIPHASSGIPADVRRTFVLTEDELAAELLKMTDAFTDELFRPQSDHDAVVAFPVSRLVVDPERFLDDNDEPMADVGMGVVYTRTSDGHPLRKAQTAAVRDDLIRRFYVPHHETLEAAVEHELIRLGAALIIDCHSFPSVPLPYEPDKSVPRPDICLGTDGFHTPDDLADTLAENLRSNGLTVEFNRPYGGTMVPMKYHRRDARVSSIMVEVNRRLYVDESTGAKNGRFDEVGRTIGEVLQVAAQ